MFILQMTPLWGAHPGRVNIIINANPPPVPAPAPEPALQSQSTNRRTSPPILMTDATGGMQRAVGSLFQLIGSIFD